jgi:hypothetical protein
VFDNQVRDSGASALPLFDELQTSLGSHLRQPILGIGRAEQPDPLASEPFLGDPHQLLERGIAIIAK